MGWRGMGWLGSGSGCAYVVGRSVARRRGRSRILAGFFSLVGGAVDIAGAHEVKN